MPHYLQRGTLPPKRHTELARAPGFLGEGICYEEVVSTEGFSRAYSTLYHLRPATRVRGIEPLPDLPPLAAAEVPLRHVHLKTGGMGRAGDLVDGRVPMFFNAEVTIARCRPAGQQRELYRNAQDDEVLFVHQGSGRLESMFGTLPFRPLDYVVIPKCTTYRVEFDDPAAADLLVIEAHGTIRFPTRYRNHDGQLRLGAPFCERDIRGPGDLRTVDTEGPHAILVRDGRRLVRYEMAHHPFDVVGWDGMVYPFAFNAEDFEPITGRIHQPPPIHQTFEGPGFVICTFAPRMLDTDPRAVKVPYIHSNVESDELLYYVRGQFGSRRGVDVGSFTLHPHGIPHGPHPGTIVASRAATRTDELAVMIDTFRPLHVARPGFAFDQPDYPFSWLEG
jgi:homogentisate 1,2-dioxygenase